MTADKHEGITQLGYNAICGDIIYYDFEPERILFDGGYVTFVNNRPAYHFYLADHQGNVRMVASAGGAVEETNHYYPFGALFGESAGGGRQHYKYNGKELDRLLALDWYDYGARWYDPVLARWHIIDPLANEAPGISPYAYCNNNAVNAVDPDGRKVIIWYKNKQGEDRQFIFTGFHGKNYIVHPRDKLIKDFLLAYMYNVKNGGGDNMIKAVTNKKYNIEVRDATLYEDFETEYYNDGNPYVFWESRKGLKTSNGGKQSPATRLEHEFDHAIDDLTNAHNHGIRQKQKDVQYFNKEEERVITGSERKTAKANKEDIRYDHYGKIFDVSDPTKVY